MKILTVVGARPQFVKAAAVSRVMRGSPGVQEVLVHTGQHYDADMSDIFFEELEIPRPDYHLGIGSGSHGAQTGRMLEQIERVLLEIKPAWMLVYGDTNSTLAGALAACKLHVPVAHVEAGLRSFNRAMPEEVNRVVVDHLSALLFAPTEAAVENLSREGIAGNQVRLVGDVMYDAARFYAGRADAHVLQKLGLEAGGYVLATVHRAENTDDPGRLRGVMEGLRAAGEECPVVLPLHPRTRAALAREGFTDPGPRLRLVDPLGYLDMIALEKHARLIATDSGGVQKEAFFFGVPCVTLREETEWVELVKLGWNRLLPPRSKDIVRDGVIKALGSAPPVAAPAGLYGGGEACAKIVRMLREAA